MTSHSEQEVARHALLTPQQRAKLAEIAAAPRAGAIPGAVHHADGRSTYELDEPRSSSPAIVPELRNPAESASEHIRNAVTILALCNVASFGALVLSPDDASAVLDRLRAALVMLEGLR